MILLIHAFLLSPLQVCERGPPSCCPTALLPYCCVWPACRCPLWACPSNREASGTLPSTAMGVTWWWWWGTKRRAPQLTSCLAPLALHVPLVASVTCGWCNALTWVGATTHSVWMSVSVYDCVCAYCYVVSEKEKERGEKKRKERERARIFSFFLVFLCAYFPECPQTFSETKTTKQWNRWKKDSGKWKKRWKKEGAWIWKGECINVWTKATC